MPKQRGFTVLELIVAIVFLVAVGLVFFVQQRNLNIAARDSQRKMAINEIYYNLEDVYYPSYQAYPEHLTADQLKGVDPGALKDPNGITVGDYGSDYRYEPKDCTSGKCKSYTLTSKLEHEADYTKTSRNK